MKAAALAFIALSIAASAAAQDEQPSNDAYGKSLECAAVLGLRWTDAADPDRLVPHATHEVQAKAAFEQAVMLGIPLGYNRNQVAAEYFQVIHRHIDALMSGTETDEQLGQEGDACVGTAAAGSI